MVWGGRLKGPWGLQAVVTQVKIEAESCLPTFALWGKPLETGAGSAWNGPDSCGSGSAKRGGRPVETPKGAAAHTQTKGGDQTHISSWRGTVEVETYRISVMSSTPQRSPKLYRLNGFLSSKGRAHTNQGKASRTAPFQTIIDSDLYIVVSLFHTKAIYRGLFCLGYLERRHAWVCCCFSHCSLDQASQAHNRLHLPIVHQINHPRPQYVTAPTCALRTSRVYLARTPRRCAKSSCTCGGRVHWARRRSSSSGGISSFRVRSWWLVFREMGKEFNWSERHEPQARHRSHISTHKHCVPAPASRCRRCPRPGPKPTRRRPPLRA